MTRSGLPIAAVHPEMFLQPPVGSIQDLWDDPALLVTSLQKSQHLSGDEFCLIVIAVGLPMGSVEEEPWRDASRSVQPVQSDLHVKCCEGVGAARPAWRSEKQRSPGQPRGWHRGSDQAARPPALTAHLAARTTITSRSAQSGGATRLTSRSTAQTQGIAAVVVCPSAIVIG